MARQRVIFISGIGELIPGQISSIAQAEKYVTSLGSFFTQGKLLAPSTGASFTNPIVGAATQLASVAGLSAALGTLGVPQNVQNAISSSINTGGLFIELNLNPQRIDEDKEKIITEVPTAAGFGELHWGLKLTRLNFNLITRNLRPGLSQARKASAAAAQQNLDQLERFFEVNNFNIGLIYQNKIYVGHFEGKFKKTRDVANPNIITVSFTFVIDKLPQIVLPGVGVFNINTIPFSI